MLHSFAVSCNIRIQAQEGFVSACFCGLRYHGGYPPTSPEGVEPQPWSYRFVLVCYPPSAIMGGKSRLAFAPLPKGELFNLSPEMLNPECVHHVFASHNFTDGKPDTTIC